MCASQLSISSSMLHTSCCTVCTVWPQLPGFVPLSNPSAPACSIRGAVLHCVYCMTSATRICASPLSISSSMLHTLCCTVCTVWPQLQYLDMRLPAIQQQQHVPYTYSSTTLCVLYDLSYLDLRLPAIHQQQHALYVVPYCVYCMTSATWICASRPATSCCMFSCHNSITPPSTQREWVGNFFSILQVNLKQTLLSNANVAFHQLKNIILSFSKTVNSYKL
jgi:hypothetical protein